MMEWGKAGRGTNLCKGPGVRVMGMFGEQEEVGFCVCLVHCSVSSAWNCAWHMVGAQ